jgi:DNA-binding NtrC family response regulator
MRRAAMSTAFATLASVDQGNSSGVGVLDTRGPFAVVVSDMRMGTMNDARFLGAVGERAPDTVRIMTTGYANFNIAKEAINLGHVYSMMTKPFTLQELVGTGK